MSTFVRQWLGKIRDADSTQRARRRTANDLFFFTFAAVTNSYSAAAWVIFHVIRNTNGTGDRIQQELATLAVDSDPLPRDWMLVHPGSNLSTSLAVPDNAINGRNALSGFGCLRVIFGVPTFDRGFYATAGV
jgi:hypothetical protein